LVAALATLANDSQGISHQLGDSLAMGPRLLDLKQLSTLTTNLDMQLALTAGYVRGCFICSFNTVMFCVAEGISERPENCFRRQS
jgi:hypothetical protein